MLCFVMIIFLSKVSNNICFFWIKHPLVFKREWGFPGDSDGKVSACDAGDLGREDSPGERNGYPLLYSCLEKPMVRRAWWAIVHGVAKSWT